MLRRYSAEGYAHDGVSACSEHPQLAVADQLIITVFDLMLEGKAHTRRFANPVGLHDAHALWPAG